MSKQVQLFRLLLYGLAGILAVSGVPSVEAGDKSSASDPGYHTPLQYTPITDLMAHSPPKKRRWWWRPLEWLGFKQEEPKPKPKPLDQERQPPRPLPGTATGTYRPVGQ